MKMKNILITGSSSGIGLELVKMYLERNYNVYAVCRKASEILKQTQAIIIDDVDLLGPDFENILKNKIQNNSINILINCAGLFLNETINTLNFQQIREQFEVNSIAPLRVVNCLLTNLGTDSKIIMITSRMGSIEDNNSGGYYGYRSSKAALNMFAKSLSIDLKTRFISVATIHPGYVKTKMTKFNGEITALESAQNITNLIENLTINQTGSFYHCNGDLLPW